MNNQSADIRRAISRLEALTEKTAHPRLMTLARQIDSYHQHKDVALEAADIVTDFLTEICASATALGNDDDTKGIRGTFRAHILDAVDDVFWDADAWADDWRETAEDRADRQYQHMKEGV